MELRTRCMIGGFPPVAARTRFGPCPFVLLETEIDSLQTLSAGIFRFGSEEHGTKERKENP